MLLAVTLTLERPVAMVTFCNTASATRMMTTLLPPPPPWRRARPFFS